MKNLLSKRVSILAPLTFVVLLFAVSPVFSADKLANEMSYRFGKKEVPQEAIEKEGFFYGVNKDRVKIKNQKTYQFQSYNAAPGMIISFHEQEIDLLRIPPFSIVKLIIVDAEVVEIVLVEESS